MLTAFQMYAVMVLCARDVDVIWHDLPPDGNPVLKPPGSANYAYLTTDVWTPLGQLRCNDVFLSNGDNVYYGLLLQCHAASGPFNVGDYMVAVRGTMDPQEWLNDATSLVGRTAPGVTGQVGVGFWDVYSSMTLNPMLGGPAIGPAAAAIAGALVRGGTDTLYICGHSLGSALATYLTADLDAALAGSGFSLNPYFFASPMPGTQDFANAYQSSVSTYTVVNYKIDAVPMVPPALLGFTALNGGGPNHDVHLIDAFVPGVFPPQLVPNAMQPTTVQNNHSPVNYARLLDPANPWVVPGLLTP